MMTLQEILTPDVARFCEREGITDRLRQALKLVQEVFPETRAISIDLVYDPEGEGEWVSLDAEVPVNGAELLARDDLLVKRRIAAVPWPERDKIVIMTYPA